MLQKRARLENLPDCEGPHSGSSDQSDTRRASVGGRFAGRLPDGGAAIDHAAGRGGQCLDPDGDPAGAQAGLRGVS